MTMDAPRAAAACPTARPRPELPPRITTRFPARLTSLSRLCAEIARRTGVKVVKAVHVSSAADIHAAEAFRTDFHLFDRRGKGLWGGTGESFDWGLLRERRSQVPAIVAGGLRPENVAEAIAVTHPFAVDVASGVEAEPGRKDHAKMGAFFEAAKAASVSAA